MKSRSLKSRRPTTFSSHFPLDLLSQVLGRLPVKTLLKFRCVSKEWRSLIDSSAFASLHFTLYNNNRQNVSLFLIEEDRQFGIHRGWRRCSIRRSDTFRATYQVDLPNDFTHLWPVGYANGFALYCKLDDAKVVTSFVIWNPSTRKSTEIANPPRSYLMEHIRVVLVEPSPGVVKDYKFVIIPFDHPTWNRGVNIGRICSTVGIRVYSFNTASWRSCRIPSMSVVRLRFRQTIVFLNGALHWMGLDPLKKLCVVVFDVGSNALRYFRLPAVPVKDIVRCGRLCVLGESLVLVKVDYGGCFIWVMEQYGVDESWVNRIKILTGDDKSFLYLRSNGNLFFRTRRGLMVYDIHSRQIQSLPESCKDVMVLVDDFVETLALPPGGNKEPDES